ncbi:MAG: FliM/FliN family flagellar motor switch protein [Pirellulales bacterium]|nr:FliM/FliN family flagellar motor switch protein [Pirellulales bacterium]
MSELTPQLAPEVLAACTAGAEEAAGAFSRALDGPFALAVGEAGAYAAARGGVDLAGPGLAVLMTFGDAAAVAVIPESSGLLPGWYAAPDPTGESKLSTLAQELSMLLVPETLMADVFEAHRVDDLAAGLARAGAQDDSATVSLTLTAGEKSGPLLLVWPLARGAELFPPAPAPAPEPAKPAAAATPAPVAAASAPQEFDPSRLSPQSRSRLRVQVAVSVRLATKKESIQDIVAIAPGTIVKFDKPCDELLQLFAGNQAIAEGEAVKIGEKFGFRVTSILLPQERFVTMTLKPRRAG